MKAECPRRVVRHQDLAGRYPSALTSFHQVFSFVPIPGAQQHKRPRRKFEEIERMYRYVSPSALLPQAGEGLTVHVPRCDYQGCEKAYGTLNHLNAHVTMQSHGQKRTPEGETASRFASLGPAPV